MFESFSVTINNRSVIFVCSASGPSKQPSLKFSQWNSGEYEGRIITFVGSGSLVVTAELTVNYSVCQNIKTFTCTFATNCDTLCDFNCDTLCDSSISSTIKCPVIINDNYENSIASSASTNYINATSTKHNSDSITTVSSYTYMLYYFNSLVLLHL